MVTSLIGCLQLLGAGNDCPDALTSELSLHKVKGITTGACTVMKDHPCAGN